MGWARRLLNTVRRRHLDGAIERELRFHLQESADALRSGGLSADEAEREARRRLGDPFRQHERTREVDVARWLDAALRSVRHAGRSARRAPAWSAAVVVTLGAGIGANTAVFSAIDAVLLRPLPAPESDRLVRVLERAPSESEATQIAPVRLEDWARRSTAFEGLTGYYVEDVSDTTGVLPERIRRAVVSPRFLATWRVAPAIGHDFAEDALRSGGTSAVLVSDRYWRTRLGADAAVLARVLRIEGRTYAIAGVLPRSFPFPDDTVDVWWPYPVDGAALGDASENRRQRWYTGLGRLRAGIDAAGARADLDRVQAGLAREHAATDTGLASAVVPLKQTVVGDAGLSLWVVYGAVSLLLLVACTNVASLWLARAAERRGEVALRLSLGASRAALAGQLLVEAALLSGVGAVLGLALASGAGRVVLRFLPDLPRRAEIGVDARLFAYAAAAAFAVTLLCGIAPALRQVRLASDLAAGGRSSTGRHRTQWLLAGAQTALAVALLVCAGLLARSVHALARVDPGFDPERVLALRVSASWSEADDRTALVARIERTLDHLQAVPGVARTATAWSLPGTPRRYQTEFTSAGGTVATALPMPAEWRSVSPGYFDVLRIASTDGSACRAPREGSLELVVNRRFADRFFGGRSPLGVRLAWESGSLSGTVVGVVGDARESGLDRDPPPTVYACDTAPSPFPWVLLRTAGDPAAVAATVRAAMKDLDAERSVYDLAPLTERLDRAYERGRTRSALLAGFAAAALLLAALGVHATLGYAVGLRRRETGLRLALGAPRGRLVAGLLWEALRVALAGCAAGVVLALAARETLAGLLFGVSPSDPWTYGAVVGLTLAVAGLAALVPALRAAALDPLRVLREP